METEYEYLTAHQRRTYRILHSILQNLTDDDVSWMCVQIVLFLKASYPQAIIVELDSHCKDAFLTDFSEDFGHVKYQTASDFSSLQQSLASDAETFEFGDFSRIFPQESSTEDIYENIAGLGREFVKGYNCSIAMIGDRYNPGLGERFKVIFGDFPYFHECENIPMMTSENSGLFGLFSKEIFASMSKVDLECFTLRISILTAERQVDLLKTWNTSDSDDPRPRIRTRKSGTYIDNIVQLRVNSLEDVIRALNYALENQQELNRGMSLRLYSHYFIYYLHHKNDELGIDRESRFVFANTHQMKRYTKAMYHTMNATSLEYSPLQGALESMHKNFTEYGNIWTGKHFLPLRDSFFTRLMFMMGLGRVNATKLKDRTATFTPSLGKMVFLGGIMPASSQADSMKRTFELFRLIHEIGDTPVLSTFVPKYREDENTNIEENTLEYKNWLKRNPDWLPISLRDLNSIDWNAPPR